MSYIRARSYLRWRMCFLEKTWPASIARRLAAMRCYRINSERNKEAERKFGKNFISRRVQILHGILREREKKFVRWWDFCIFGNLLYSNGIRKRRRPLESAR